MAQAGLWGRRPGLGGDIVIAGPARLLPGLLFFLSGARRAGSRGFAGLVASPRFGAGAVRGGFSAIWRRRQSFAFARAATKLAVGLRTHRLLPQRCHVWRGGAGGFLSRPPAWEREFLVAALEKPASIVLPRITMNRPAPPAPTAPNTSSPPKTTQHQNRPPGSPPPSPATQTKPSTVISLYPPFDKAASSFFCGKMTRPRRSYAHGAARHQRQEVSRSTDDGRGRGQRLALLTAVIAATA